MANHPSAVKRHKQSLKRRQINTTSANRLKTQMKKLKTAITARKSADAKALIPATFSLIDKSVQKGVIKKNTAARYKSRLNKSVNMIPAAS
jgi:small subunit ribosomal protein S20